MVEINTDKNASRALDQDQMEGVLGVISSRVMWRIVGSPYLIQQPRLNCNDSYFCVS